MLIPSELHSWKLFFLQLSGVASERDSARQEKEKLAVSVSELQTALQSREQELQQARTKAETEKVRFLSRDRERMFLERRQRRYVLGAETEKV